MYNNLQISHKLVPVYQHLVAKALVALTNELKGAIPDPIMVPSMIVRVTSDYAHPGFVDKEGEVVGTNSHYCIVLFQDYPDAGKSAFNVYPCMDLIIVEDNLQNQALIAQSGPSLFYSNPN